MRNKIAIVVTTAVFTFMSATRGLAQQQQQTAPIASASAVGSVAISPLKKGQPAPFSGILFTPRAAASIVTEISTARERTQIEVTAAVASAEAKKDYTYNEAATKCETDKRVVLALAEGEKKKVDILNEDIKKLREEMPSRGTWLGVGMIGGFLLSSVTFFAVTRISK